MAYYLQTIGATGPGGIMEFFTDGKQDCRDFGGLTIQDVKDDVIESGVRIITVAIG